MASNSPRPLVYRLRGCPAHLHPGTAAEFLSREFGDVSRDDIQIQSLATDPEPWVTSPTKVGTLVFKRLPALIETQKEQDTWDLKVLGFERPLVLDTHFRGMTPLNDVEEAKHEFNCIAISGLASHPFGSWQPKGRDKSFMWLRDELPRAIPETRISIYGYDTTLAGSTSFQSIQDLAVSLIDHIKSSGWALPSAKPLIFLAHSLGGIVLKEMFTFLADSDELAAHILGLFKGGIFFGVPSQGMSTSHLLAMVKNQVNEQMVHDLSSGSEYLQELDDKFSGLSLVRDIRIYWGYETKTSPTVMKTADGSFTREGPEEILVSKESATHNRYGSKPPFTFPINENHSEMAKFGADNPNLRIVKDKLRELCQDSSRSNSSVRTRAEVPNPTLESHGTIENNRLMGHDEPRASTAHHTRSWSIKDLMESLEFFNQGSRFHTIDKNYEHTYEWVFDVEKTPFATWLEDGNNFFWIHGKPGSGKSTLMKFIAEDKRTLEHLHELSSGAFRISAMFFFHDRGTLLQKSFEGLLRSILHQIIGQIQQCGRAGAELIEGLLRQLPPRREQDNPWTLNILENCLRQILHQTVLDLKIFVLLDALDEHDMNPDFICRFLQDMISMTANSRTKLKVLFSSRPWEEFTHDIENYCWGMVYSRGEEPSITLSPIIPKVIDRANGVFLWVKLALHELMNEAAQKNTDELESSLNSIPSDLQDYYVRTLRRIPENLRWNAYVIFEVLSKTDRSLGPIDIIDIIECSKKSSYEGCRSVVDPRRVNPEKNMLKRLWHGEKPNKKKHIEEPYKLDAKRKDRIVTTTGNLVEIIKNKRGPFVVQFIHQTVREFVRSRDFKQTILAILNPRDRRIKENGHTFLVKYYFAEGQINPCSLRHISLHEATTGNSLKGFIDSIPKEAYDNYYHKHIHDHVKGPLSLAVSLNLGLYLEDTLRAEPDVFRNTKEELVSVRPYSITHAPRQLSLLRFVFENGYAVKHIGEIMAAMKLLYYSEEFSLYEYIDEKVPTAIAHCQDADIWFQPSFEIFDNRPRIFRQFRPHRVKILHEARTPEFARCILDRGAEVNETDSLGNTPLDHIISDFRIPHGDPGKSDESWLLVKYATSLLLIERGGITRSSTRKQWNRHLVKLRSAGLDTAILEECSSRSLEQRTTEKMKRLVNRFRRGY
ncbi:uncharacterized protein F4807DRAFT_472944 [Annulohypoxylon truncatum]|uniref:uncharacterized protein n=1 Tax=Annulohypoxylon truncatum TaxID=327061 RepID=UPI0020080E66|nr:uncharacterized protein F4807DRAFT_472944 [Annulohypoxylon truncatum]KAI1211486.1 hypothetical protein F4807DRAFT_472944 [Annulohypoxylon truncatum]